MSIGIQAKAFINNLDTEGLKSLTPSFRVLTISGVNEFLDLLLYDGPHFLNYMSNEETLDKLLSLPDGKICCTELLCKDFPQDSEILRLQ